ncbi:MAG: class I SAM-dependent methyltransferase [Albidovulum sp.]|nr:class I SAM-dependent methyltransferase [Albidovulum sp.]
MVCTEKLNGFTRFDLFKLLGGNRNEIGIELGVATGDYSKKMVSSGYFRQFFGIDMYADTHDTEQYKRALAHVGIFENYKILRMTFEEALDLFPDNTFGFLYLDGYAATGFEGGKTIRSWSKKVKIGGVIAGDDYHEDFPLLQKVVNEVCEQNKFELMVTEGAFDNSAYGSYPSWAFIKTKEIGGETARELVVQGNILSRKLRRKKLLDKKLDSAIKKLIPEDYYEELREWNRKRKQRRRLLKGN